MVKCTKNLTELKLARPFSCRGLASHSPLSPLEESVSLRVPLGTGKEKNTDFEPLFLLVLSHCNQLYGSFMACSEKQ